MSGFDRKLDRFAIGLSSLCLLHCLLPPVLLFLLPAVGAAYFIPEDFHLWILLAAIPTSLFALYAGHRNHGKMLPALAAFGGLCLLGYGAIFRVTEQLELILTVVGACILALAHARNARLAAAPIWR